MNNQDFSTRYTQSDPLTGDDLKVSKMLGSLNRVEVPNDFDHRLKARIANGAASGARSFFGFPVIRYALPLGIILIVAGFLISSDLLNMGDSEIQVVAEVPQQQFDVSPEIPARETARDSIMPQPQPVNSSPVNQEQFVAVANRSSNTAATRTAATVPKPSGGSIDQTLRGSNKSMFPRGINPGEVVRNQPASGGVNAKSGISIREVLSIMGVDADFGDGGWKVRAVKANSFSEPSGVRAGDVIEAVDGRPLSETTVFSGGFSGKTLNVIRDGKKLTLNLRNE